MKIAWRSSIPLTDCTAWGTGPGRFQRRGYSLIEITVVVAILAVVMLIGSTVMVKEKNNRTLDANAAEVLEVIRFARQLGVSTGGSTVSFITTTAPQTWVVYDVTGGPVPIKKGSLDLTVTSSVPAAIAPLYFSAAGAVVTTAGGTTYVNSGNAISFTLTSTGTGRRATITLTPHTGYVSMTTQ